MEDFFTNFQRAISSIDKMKQNLTNNNNKSSLIKSNDETFLITQMDKLQKNL